MVNTWPQLGSMDESVFGLYAPSYQSLGHKYSGQSLLKLDGFWAHCYPVECLAFNGTHLASGAHKELKVWALKSNGSWVMMANINPPRCSSYTTACDIIVTSLHWTSITSYPSVLVMTYMSHGIAAFEARTFRRIGGTSVQGQI
ncbi:hypothetical protein CERSUDRAFT_77601 [Gelatoporia subvermispora B]|uniref:Uncharacterized protein n=1 Tax=Ceriporiopsis subvermispora (strain B) TaxID=914234 RepID=M2Q647_CERS8|nr:hypothetical protein CERSUDRAFT_77601 [Gelatoporia subvermispora B]